MVCRLGAGAGGGDRRPPRRRRAGSPPDEGGGDRRRARPTSLRGRCAVRGSGETKPIHVFVFVCALLSKLSVLLSLSVCFLPEHGLLGGPDAGALLLCADWYGQLLHRDLPCIR